MATYRTGTIYTSVVDTWETLTKATKLSRKELISLNPHLADVTEIEPGIPVDVPYNLRREILLDSVLIRENIAAQLSAYQIARDELLMDIAEFPGESHNNPRITLYHSTTTGGAAPDEVAWCSSFVNFCVERAGLQGTDSKAARSWLQFGVKVPRPKWRTGDIIVFKRGTSTWQGHVGFLVDTSGSRPRVLGGNQSDRLCIATPYPYSAILSVRRAS